MMIVHVGTGVLSWDNGFHRRLDSIFHKPAGLCDHLQPGALDASTAYSEV